MIRLKRAIRRKHYRIVVNKWKNIIKNVWRENDIDKIESISQVPSRVYKNYSAYFHKHQKDYSNELSKQQKIANDILKIDLKEI